jgi:type VI secretion system protein ImpJ
MKRLQPVIWMKGTLLSPQYLQSQDRYLESSLKFHLDAALFAPWGVLRLQFDQQALAAGYVALTDAAGIFPDGLLFDIPEADPAPSPKPLADCFDPDQKTLDLYLAIPQFRDRGLNVALPEAQTDTRFVSEVSMLRDENTGLGERPIQVARKNFRILVQGESQQHSSVLRIGRVERTAAGLYQLDTRFVPPLLDLGTNDFLVSILRRLVEILAAKSSQLAGTRRQKNLSLADFGAADIANFWLLYTINSNFPLLQHLFETRRGHPERLYEVMLSLAGSLSTFSPTLHPRDFPKYEHNELSFCFEDLDEKIRLLLETVVPSNFISLPLKLTQSSIYATALADDRYLRNTKMYLAVRAEMNEADLIAKAPYLVKVCSANHIEHLVRQALPGVALTHTQRPPSAIPVKLNYQYFGLSQTGVAWEAVTRARNLAAYIPGDFPKAQLELIILLPEA